MTLPVSQLALELNPTLDPTDAARTLAASGRVQIRDFLKLESARSLHQLLKDHQPWFLSFNRGNENLEVPLSNLDRTPAAGRQEFLDRVYARAAQQFQYLFIQYYITESLQRGEDPEHPLHAVHHFLNSDNLIDYFRRLTGEPAASKVDVMASRYDAGHFLTRHDDSHAHHDRVAAYVLNLTPDWNADWGGHLAFFDDKGNIEQAFVPCFNTLNVFLVPQDHAVQMVAPFARSSRLSFTGWVQR